MKRLMKYFGNYIKVEEFTKLQEFNCKVIRAVLDPNYIGSRCSTKVEFSNDVVIYWAEGTRTLHFGGDDGIIKKLEKNGYTLGVVVPKFSTLDQETFLGMTIREISSHADNAGVKEFPHNSFLVDVCDGCQQHYEHDPKAITTIVNNKEYYSCCHDLADKLSKQKPMDVKA